ncbi:MAG: tetraacyldisaccharide 4'-kinase [Thermoguttaceae bacterium]
MSGRKRGPWAALLRAALAAAEVPYSWAVRRRNHRFDTHPASIHRAGAPVVSVGNLTLGGTGKTPAVEWLVRWFGERKARVGIVSRGYGVRRGQQNDEALELAASLPGVPHVQDPDRVAAARRAVADFDCQVLVLDDAFQHRRLARDLDIVLLDALEPFGFERVFPRGTLREPLEGLRRAQVVALSRADILDHSQREEIRRRVEQLAPRAAWLEVAHAVKELVSAGGDRQPITALEDQPLAAFCALGNPAGFRHTLMSCGYRVAGFREFPDHHWFAGCELDRLAAWAGDLGAKALLCTQKDLAKIGADRLGDLPLWAVAVRLEILRGQELLEDRLEPLLPA